MKTLFFILSLCSLLSSFSQLSHVNGFKKNEYDLYEMTFKDAREAIMKYNDISDKNGADTSGSIYNVMINPIDFAFFKNNPESDNIIVSILFTDGKKYKVMFGEFDSREDKTFFDIQNEMGETVSLVYKTP